MLWQLSWQQANTAILVSEGHIFCIEELFPIPSTANVNPQVLLAAKEGLSQSKIWCNLIDFYYHLIQNHYAALHPQAYNRIVGELQLGVNTLHPLEFQASTIPTPPHQAISKVM